MACNYETTGPNVVQKGEDNDFIDRRLRAKDIDITAYPSMMDGNYSEQLKDLVAGCLTPRPNHRLSLSEVDIMIKDYNDSREDMNDGVDANFLVDPGDEYKIGEEWQGNNVKKVIQEQKLLQQQQRLRLQQQYAQQQSLQQRNLPHHHPQQQQDSRHRLQPIQDPLQPQPQPYQQPFPQPHPRPQIHSQHEDNENADLYEDVNGRIIEDNQAEDPNNGETQAGNDGGNNSNSSSYIG